MFGSKNKTKEISPAPQQTEKKSPPKLLSVIAEGIEIGGELNGAGDVQLDGNFTGSIKCHNLTIGSSGKLYGTVEAEQVTVLGYLKGEIRSKRVNLKNSAQIIGDVYHDILEVAAGAKIEGRYSRKMSFETKAKDKSSAPHAAVSKETTDALGLKPSASIASLTNEKRAAE
ncbi:MAG: polymer-forming cytoskeletal protein [Alphaproteobacteria bacterium]|nr:polymer-forming cytoskeletal protein [Alphaproteobacteria bacterium]